MEEELLTNREGILVKALLDNNNMQLEETEANYLRSQFITVFLLLNLLREDF